MATTTIQISQETKEELNNLKFRGETYENVISDLIEDRYVLNEFIKFNQTKDSFQLSNSSIILNKLIEQKGGTEKNILTELEKRKRILEVLSEINILEFKEVSKIMKVYYQGTENIFNYIENL